MPSIWRLFHCYKNIHGPTKPPKRLHCMRCSFITDQRGGQWLYRNHIVASLLVRLKACSFVTSRASICFSRRAFLLMFNLLVSLILAKNNNCVVTYFRQNVSWVLNFIEKILMSARSKAWTVFTHSNTGVVGSNLARRHGCLCAFILCLCCSMCR
jgi:hypothetical protein